MDVKESKGLVPLLQSLQLFSTEKIMVHIVTNTKDKALIDHLISCNFQSSHIFNVSNIRNYDPGSNSWSIL